MLAGFLRVVLGMNVMAVGHVGVMAGFVVIPGFMVCGCGEMMLRGVLVVLGGFLVMVSALFRHV
jgi:hypothetical protein